MMMVIRMIKAWTDDAWNDYLYWYEQGNRATVKKINRLIKDIDRHPFEGIGKPEPLKHELQGKWSRRITQEDRLIYEIDSQEETVVIYSAKDHY
jgi:toxin YoeB